MSNEKHTIWGYGRVSDGGKQVSLLRQREAVSYWIGSTMRDYKYPKSEYSYNEKENWFEDLNVSGYEVKILERPSMQSIMNRIRPGDLLIISHLDRLSRDVSDLLRFSKMLEEVDIKLFMIDVQIDTSTSEGRMMLTNLAAFAEYERNRMIERTMAGKRRLNADGCITCARKAPIGWMRIRKFEKKFGKKVTRMKPDTKTRDLANRMLDMKKSGMTYRQIEDVLWDEKVLLPKRKAPYFTGANKPGRMIYGDQKRRFQFTEKRIIMYVTSARNGFPESPTRSQANKKSSKVRTDVSIYSLLSPASRAQIPPALLAQSLPLD